MTAKGYLIKINKAMRDAGTYNEIFDQTIKTLADILAERDHIREIYIKEGSQPIVEVILTGGISSQKPNPLLNQWNELNKTALSFWKELGLTASGLKKINDEALEGKKMSSLDKVLSNLEKT